MSGIYCDSSELFIWEFCFLKYPLCIVSILVGIFLGNIQYFVTKSTVSLLSTLSLKLFELILRNFMLC